MCGIVGVFQHQSNKINNQSFINWALKDMERRGPDSNGNWCDDVCHQGFVRLSIRDLTTHASQPMHSSCGRYVLSFNGEIYNQQIFEEELKKDGIQFQSTSDTEVLLYSLIKWNAKDFLPKLNGMFAFAFYDKQTKKLLLARDRVGIKPLYIGWSNDGIVYSSQYNHIINHSYCSNNNLDASAIATYLNLGYVPEKNGIIQNTMLFPHGHYAEIQQGSELIIHEYYQYPATVTNTNKPSLNKILEKSVTQQLVSDVPIGTFMSGGTDSTLVTSYAVKQQQNIQSFTIGVNDKTMDESEAAQAFANIFQTKHQCTFIEEKDVLNMLDANFKAYSEPFADYSSLPTLLLSEVTRKHVTVALSGDGGDELFWGYPRNQKIINAAKPFEQNLLWRNLSFLKEKILKPKQRTVFKRHLLSADYLEYYYKSLFINGAELWLNNMMNVNAATPYFLQTIQVNKTDLTNVSTIMNKTRKLETDIHLQRILLKVDRASMHHSLEVRVPLLDNDVLDYSTCCNYTECIKDGTGKYNLKQLLAAKTNTELVFKPKKGFTIPLAKWMRNELKNEIALTIFNMPPQLATFFNKKTIEEMWQKHLNNQQDNSWILWAVYSLIKWDAAHRNKFKN